MFQLFPVPVIANLFLILLAQCLPIETVALGKNGNTYGSGLNLLLLKKKQTRC